MSCAACSARVEKAVSAVDGVDSCAVNLLSGIMTVEGGEDSAVKNAVISAGYGVTEYEKAAALLNDNEGGRILRRLLVSLAILLPLMYIAMGRMLGAPLPEAIESRPLLVALMQAVLSLAVLSINWRFFYNGVRGVVKLAPNMDTLVALGSGASFGYSVAVVCKMAAEHLKGNGAHELLHELYFESAAMILVLITVGKMLEARAKGKTTSAISSLMSLAPKTARVLRDGGEAVISVDEVVEGDIFILRPGDAVPVDGIVIKGEGSVDEACLTGESVPADKAEGDRVFGGTINRFGYLEVRATAVGEGTVLSSIIRLVEEASSTKAPIAKLADKVSGIFVPLVMSISLLTLVGWLLYGAGASYAVGRAISVLVISCPCALGLATPVAIMVGSGVGAKRGILFKTASALEISGRVNVALIDKTGTLTVGTPKVTDLISFTDDEGELLSVAYTLERYSEHPLGVAVAKYCEQRGARLLESTGFEAKTGRGVSCKIDGEDCFGASFEYAKQLCAIPASAHEAYATLTAEGKTPVCFTFGGVLLGILATSDVIKPDAAIGIATLKQNGITPIMLTGDNPRTAEAIARACGIERVYAGVLPGGKSEIVHQLKAEGRVLMVGDGINDAPALTSADVGLAVGRGTDIAIESADVVLTSESFTDVSAAISLGRATLKNIKQNLFFAFLYNCICIPLAAGLFGFGISPMIGAAAMSLSSISVVSNALRLNLWKPKFATEAGVSPDFKPIVNNCYQTNNEENEDRTMEFVIKVNGMMCPHCEARVKKVLEQIEGVTAATPDHKAGIVTVQADASVALAALEAAITEQGYDVVK